MIHVTTIQITHQILAKIVNKRQTSAKKESTNYEHCMFNESEFWNLSTRANDDIILWTNLNGYYSFLDL